jgi:hypothetical protein
MADRVKGPARPIQALTRRRRGVSLVGVAAEDCYRQIVPNRDGIAALQAAFRAVRPAQPVDAD